MGGKVMRIVLMAIGALVLVGCASTGQNFDATKVSKIEEGKTTEADLIQMFGEPTHRNYSSEGTKTLKWVYSEYQVKGESFIPYAGPFVGGSESAQKSLTVTLTSDGIVQRYNASVGEMETRSNRLQEAK